MDESAVHYVRFFKCHNVWIGFTFDNFAIWSLQISHIQCGFGVSVYIGCVGPDDFSDLHVVK